MHKLKAIKRHELIRHLRDLGFDGPYSGKKHQFMVKEEITVRLPNPHESDIGKELLKRILRQAQIDTDTWNRL
jgi:predicted RNA binding protein YcfA (HicA-like mRNA interferase family)